MNKTEIEFVDGKLPNPHVVKDETAARQTIFPPKSERSEEEQKKKPHYDEITILWIDYFSKSDTLLRDFATEDPPLNAFVLLLPSSGP
jgi:hypothetical protein